MRIIYFIFILLFATPSYGQSIFSKSAASIRTKTTNFDNILSSSDKQVQKALETIDDSFKTEYPPSCSSLSDWCMIYEDGVVKLYVDATLQTQYPITSTYDYLLLETGDFLLLESGDKLILQ